MFTGIVEDVGTVARVAPGEGGGRTLWIRTRLDPATIAVGDSVCTNGVCLTAVRVEGDVFAVDAGPETLSRTTVGDLGAGSKVNLERSVTPTTRLGGHMVAGHVDAVGTVAAVRQRENAWDLDVEVPEEVLRLAIPRGSIAVDGVSLTITGRTDQAFGLSIIPHTWDVTTFAALKPGSKVNVEADVIARYVAGLLEAFQKEGSKPGLTAAFLEEHGFK